jgi:glycosyltransferase involved in cell wall biosynthesis
LDKSYKEGVTIVICFYNAALRIVPTLEHIIAQRERNYSNTELILINNASTDDSDRIIKETMQGFSLFPWKIVHEKTPGLANARLCGLENATFDILLYCDDDNWLDFDYVNKAELILRNDFSIGILGGLGRAISSIPIPDWFENVQNYYAVGPQMPASGRVIGSRNVVYGAGMLIRKAVFEELLTAGFVFQSLGRTKSNLSAGEDSELCLAVQIMGYQIYYDDSLTFGHFIEPKRLTEEYFNRMKMGMGLSSFYGRFYRDYFFGKRFNVSKFFWVKELFYVVKDLIHNFIKLKFNNGRHISLITFLLKERGNYDKRVAEVLFICEKLSAE